MIIALPGVAVAVAVVGLKKAALPAVAVAVVVGGLKKKLLLLLQLW